MSKMLITSRIALAVLTAGLASCRPDKTTTDVYRAKPPVIRIGGKTVEFADMKNDQSRDLDLQDTIDVREARPVEVRFQVSCRVADRNWDEVFDFKGDRPIALLEVIPQAMLALDFREVEAVCSYDIMMQNKVGSKHILSLNSVRVVETSEPKIEIVFADGAQELKPLVVQSSNVDDLVARYAHVGYAAAKVQCTETQTPAIGFDSNRRLSEFDFSDPDHELTPENRRQACRILVIQDGRRLATSRLFEFRRPVKELLIDFKILRGTRDPAKSRLARLVVGNPSGIIRKLRIPKELNARFWNATASVTDMKFRDVPRAVTLENVDAAPSSWSSPSTRTVEIAPESAIAFELYCRDCIHSSNAYRWRISVRNFEVQEVDTPNENGAELVFQNFPINFYRPVTFVGN